MPPICNSQACCALSFRLYRKLETRNVVITSTAVGFAVKLIPLLSRKKSISSLKFAFDNNWQKHQKLYGNRLAWWFLAAEGPVCKIMLKLVFMVVFCGRWSFMTTHVRDNHLNLLSLEMSSSNAAFGEYYYCSYSIQAVQTKREWISVNFLQGVLRSTDKWGNWYIPADDQKYCQTSYHGPTLKLSRLPCFMKNQNIITFSVWPIIW